jgi:choline dehydrogenase
MDRFDYVVVGAGSAGSVLAARLSEEPRVTVALLEAGARRMPDAVERDIAEPSHWGLVQHTVADWQYVSVPQPHLNDRRTEEPRGRLPGGSSNLYILMHVRGHRSDFDGWAWSGCPGWGFADVLPFFRKLEDQDADDNPLAGRGGPLPVYSAARLGPNPTSRSFLDACAELGFARTDDFNGATMEGAGWHHLNIRAGRRYSTREAYLEPALARPNLTLIDEAHATRLVFRGRACAGVEYRRSGAARHVAATRQVVVCAGAIESPKLLLLSGLGEARRLAALGIAALVDLPGVGENFHNHVLTPVVAVARQPIPDARTSMSEAALFYRSEPGWPGPDMQMAFVHGDPRLVSAADRPSVMVLLPGVVRPMSRGTIRLASPEPLAPPLIDPSYLACESDHRRLTDGVRLARRLFATSAFAPWVQAVVSPGPEVTDDALGAWVRSTAESYHHQAGSCRMGLDALAVVDPSLRVHGVTGLRVADASVMPAVVSGNCHAAVVMIAERAAAMIAAERPGG